MRIAPSLHRIGSDLLNSDVVEYGGGITIIDAGPPGHWTELTAELAHMGRSLDDIRGVVLTHGDTDHIGSRSGSVGSTAYPSTCTSSMRRGPW